MRFFPQRRSSRIALLAVLLGLGLHGVGFWLVRIEMAPVHAPLMPAPFVRMVGRAAHGQDALVREQSWLLDSKPLFMPMPQNSAPAVDDIAGLREQTELYGAYAAHAVLAEEPLRVAPQPPPSRRDLLNQQLARPVPWWDGLGRIAKPMTPLSERAASIALTRLDGPAFQLALDLPSSALPQLGSGEAWNPFSGFMEVTVEGARGLPLVVATTGSAARDEVLRAYVQSPDLLRRLPPGYYRFEIGP